MLEYLKALAARVWRHRGPDWYQPPDDPYAGVRVPRRHGPGGRRSAVAIEEPRPDSIVDAQGRTTSGRGAS